MQTKWQGRSALAWLLALLCAVASSAALAATITVTSIADTIVPNDGAVTLREAITAINAGNDLGDPDITAQNPGAFGTSDTIHFNIAGGGVHTITLTAALPTLTKRVVIDGYSQPGASVNTLTVGDNAVLLIRIDQNGAASVFTVGSSATATTVRGLALVNTGSTAIHVQADQTTIVGNYIGVDTNGTTQTGGGTAIGVDPNVLNVAIGTGNAADRNVMASNGNDVLELLGSFLTVAGNYIDTNAAGTAALGSAVNGINIGAGSAVTIGGITSSQGNVIGQWNANGINVGQQNINFALSNVTIRANFIGVNATGTAKLNPGLNGIALLNGTYSADIGSNGGANVISGASGSGIVTGGTYTGNFSIEGNLIGTDISGTLPIPNGATGICLQTAAQGNVGNTGAGGANIIAFNGAQGISVATSTNVLITANSIFNNGGLGISLQGRCDIPVSPIPNDPGDADTGANNLQNFPVITAASIAGSQVTISGTINALPNDDLNLEFFSSVACDASGNGEGKTFLGSRNVTTDGTGNGSFGPLQFPIPAGQPIVTATATGSTNGTSEFSACLNAGGGPPLPTLSINNVSQNEGNSGTTLFTFTVTLSAASASTVTVNFATADGTATAPSDYAATSGTLTFNPGVTSQTITVNVVGDANVEPNETFVVNLSAPANATIATGQGTGTIVNDDAAALPTISINSVSANEGNSGVTPFTFTVTLSAASASTVTVNFATADGTAVAGSDYTASSGTVTFIPGVTTQTITVNVLGDTTVEASETFFVNLSGSSNATILGGQGTGTIVNDDVAIPNASVVIPTLDPRALAALVALLLALAAVALRRRR